MTLARNVLQSCLLVAGLNSACTFYTSCPDYRPSNVSSTGGSGNDPAVVSVGGEAPQGQWLNETLNLADLQSECGNVSYLSAKPDEDALIVSVAQHGLLTKASDGGQWSSLGQGQGSAMITNRGSAIVYDPSDSNVFWQTGIYNGGGLYRTDDGGETFIDLGLEHNDFVSVDFTDPERKTLLVSGHEAPRVLHYSKDGGATWRDIGGTFPEDGHICSWPLVLDGSTFLLGCGTYAGGVGGIFHSTTSGRSWERVSEHRVASGPLLASDGSQYWSGEANEGLVRSDDQGQTFQGPFGKGELMPVTPVELPDGRIAALGQRRIVLSGDKGQTWRVVSADLPFKATGIVYSAQARAFYAYHWTCEAEIPEDAVMSYAFDYEME